MGKRSKELRKRKREQERQQNATNKYKNIDGNNNNTINYQPLMEVLYKVKPPQTFDTHFYHILLKQFRKSLWPLLDIIANAYEETNPTTKKQRKEQMKRYNERNNNNNNINNVDDDTTTYNNNFNNIFTTLPITEAINVIKELCNKTYDEMKHPGYKQFRTCLHPFVVERLSEKYASISSQITSAFRDEREMDALRLLIEMRRRKDIPKLGAVQRWVRDCMNANDFAGLNSKRSIELLDSIVRLQPVEWDWKKKKEDSIINNNNNNNNEETNIINNNNEKKQDQKNIQSRGKILWNKPFFKYEKRNKTPIDPKEIKYLSLKDIPDEFIHNANDDDDDDDNNNNKKDTTEDNNNFYNGDYGTKTREMKCKKYMKTINKDMDYTIIYHEKGKDRRPINNYDLNIYTLNENKLVTFSNVGLNHQNNRKRFNVSSVPGSFIISNVLSPKECENIIQMAEASPQGYVPDEPTTAAKPPEGYAPRASNLVILSEKITTILYNRTKEFLPLKLGNNNSNELVGLNTRLRFYRYQPGAIYRPHVDGSWPGSGIHDGKYHYDYYGDRWSRLTFLVYLNDDFHGGGTSFYVPSKDVGNLEAFTVEPRQGSVLIFPHGGSCGSLVHEGSFCKIGVKYIIRTDVLYSIPGHERKRFDD